MSSSPKIFGVATVGTKGQIVIPSEARKALNIKSGDKLIILSGHPGRRRMITLTPENEFAKFLKMFEEHIVAVKEELSRKVPKKDRRGK